MLKVEQIFFDYKGFPVLNGLDLEVGWGELVGIVGPNGSGKTTLLRLIGGVLQPSSGRVLVNGTDLKLLRPSHRAMLVSIVPHNPILPRGFSVLDLVLMGRNPHLRLFQQENHDDLKIAERAMEMTKITHLGSRTLDTLSGGERQRAVVAMTLAQDTQIMLLDEPTSSLDLSHQVRMMDLVKEIQKARRGAVLIAMHDLTISAQYCHRLIMLDDGKIFAEGRPCDVLTKENISKIYGTDVHILNHPVTGTPVVLPLPRKD